MRSITSSIHQQTIKYTAWARRVLSAVGTDKFTREELVEKMGGSRDNLSKILTAMKEMNMVRKIGWGRTTWWKLRRRYT